jgi:hypothetical protein
MSMRSTETRRERTRGESAGGSKVRQFYWMRGRNVKLRKVFIGFDRNFGTNIKGNLALGYKFYVNNC